LPRRPDLIVSGINHGMNLGQDAFYSGTIAAAREGALRGIPALATSAHISIVDLVPVAALAARLALSMLEKSREPLRSGAAAPSRAPLLNLNVPAKWTGELRATRLGARIYEEVVDFRFDPRQREYLWLGGPGVRHDRDAGTDTDAYDDGAASVTPLSLDMTQASDAPLVASLVAGLATPAPVPQR
jgi:5'-nucleotidase